MGLRPEGLVRRLSQSSPGRVLPHAEDEPREPNNTPLTVDERGQLRYFGYSSYMRMVSVFPRSVSSPKADAPYSSIDPVDSEAAAHSPTTQARLIDLFFEYQNAAIPILDEQAFRQGYATDERSDYFSHFLLYSVLLRALNFDETLPNQEALASVYTQCARSRLIFEIENPKIATIAGLCLFGYYMAGLGSDRASWLYPGPPLQ